MHTCVHLHPFEKKKPKPFPKTLHYAMCSCARAQRTYKGELSALKCIVGHFGEIDYFCHVLTSIDLFWSQLESCLGLVLDS